MRFISALSFCIIFFCPCRYAHAQRPVSIKILSYNIHHANPPSKPGLIDIPAFVKVINDQKPDLVALQEVDVFTKRSGQQLDEAGKIAEGTGMKSYFAKAISFDGGGYGIAILSRFKVDSVRVIKLPSASVNDEARVLLLAYLHVKNKPFIFACTHLDAEKDEASRKLQIAEITKTIASVRYPLVIAGDFNAEPGTKIMKEYDQTFIRSCTENCENTIPSDAPTSTIDYIGYRKGDPFLFNYHQVLKERYPSDHLPVLAELQFK